MHAHFGGLWEAAVVVKSFKTHLKKVTTNFKFNLTYEELLKADHSLICIAMMMEYRSLSTRGLGHFLIGRHIEALLDSSDTNQLLMSVYIEPLLETVFWGNINSLQLRIHKMKQKHL